NPLSSSMEKGAAPSPFPGLKEELRCPVCFEPFREAVTLPCGHSFCKECLRKSWENSDSRENNNFWENNNNNSRENNSNSSREQRRRACPVCKENSRLEADPRLNYTLNNVVELLLRDGGSRELCPIHGEIPGFFCLEDKELACCSCRESRRHRGHRMRALREAAADFRAKLANMESSLRDKAKDFGAVRSCYESISRHNQAESARLERQVKREFQQLHEFLWDEERAVLARLREEFRRKQDVIQGKMERLEEESRALLHEAGQLQEDLREDDYTFLMTHKNRKRRIACTAEEPEAVPSGMLLDVAKYLGSLQYNVWKKMLDTITAVPFSLDPNSAAGWLRVSEDLSSVSNRSYKLSVENPERFSSAPCVLGSRGFSRGFHAWEVDLGGLTNWRVGISRPRPGSERAFHHDSRSGFWYIYHLPGKDGCRASNAARSEAAPGNLRKVRVELDCSEGELSFYDADLGSHVYTFHENFGGIVFPYFYVGGPQGDAEAQTLRICPLRVRIHEDIP
ncbi:TRI35 protein, partial [Aegithalos caudatus]|nr:TRI35 protein [Aegithalos caudatus]